MTLNNDTDVDVYTFMVFVLWEILPSCMLLATIARPPERHAPGPMPSFGVYKAIEEGTAEQQRLASETGRLLPRQLDAHPGNQRPLIA